MTELNRRKWLGSKGANYVHTYVTAFDYGDNERSYDAAVELHAGNTASLYLDLDTNADRQRALRTVRSLITELIELETFIEEL